MDELPTVGWVCLKRYSCVASHRSSYHSLRGTNGCWDKAHFWDQMQLSDTGEVSQIFQETLPFVVDC